MNYNKFNRIYLYIVFSTFSILVILQILGLKNRTGYLSDISINIEKTLKSNNLINIKKNQIDYITTNNSITNYVYNTRIKYYSKLFKNSDIFDVYVNQDKILSEKINNIYSYKEGSPFLYFYSSSLINTDDTINIYYTLKLKSKFIFIILIILIFVLISFYFIIKAKYLFFSTYSSIFIISILICILSLFLLPIINNIHQIYNDIYIAYFNYTRSIGFNYESMNEFYFRMILYPFSIITIIIIEIIKFNKKKYYTKYENNEYYYIPLLFIIPFITFSVVSQKIDIFYSSVFIIGIPLYLIHYKKILYFPVLLFILFYAMKSLFILFNFLFNIEVKIFFIQILSLIISVIIFNNLTKYYIQKVIKILQIVIPISILSFISYKYNYDGKIISYQEEHLRFRLIIFVMFFILFLSNIFILLKKRNIISLKKSITLPTIISIFIANLYGLHIWMGFRPAFPALFVTNDWYHYADEVYIWHQIFNLKQHLFSDFYPTSGLFSFVFGFFDNVIFNGFMTEGIFSAILLATLYSVIISILIYKHTNSIYTFFVVHFFSTIFFSYSRLYLILPIILLLSFPTLIKKRILWFALWIFCIFIYGLYYPAYAFPVMIATFPFGIIQFLFYIKNKEFIKDMKNIKCYLIYILLVFIIIISIPLLIGLFNIISLNSGQYLVIDGIKTAITELPNWIFPYISNIKIRNIINILLRIIFPLSYIIILSHIFITYLLKNRENIFEKLLSPAFFIFSFVIIFIPIVSFSTIVREATTFVGTKTGFIFPTLAILLSLSVLFYCKNKLNNDYKYIIIAVIFGILSFIEPSLFISNYNSVLFSKIITVPKDMEIIDDNLLSDFPKLGHGFILKNQKNILIKEGMILKKITTIHDSIVTDRYHNVSLISLINRKNAITFYPRFIQSTKFMKFALNKLEENPPAVFIGDPQFYPWLVEKEYKICPENRNIFIRPDRFKEVYGTIYASNDMSNFNYYTHVRTNYYLPQALGRSIDNLTKYFTNEYVVVDKNTSYTNNEYIIFNENILGKNYDYLYLELNNCKSDKIIISWASEDEKVNNNNSLTFIKSKEDKYLVPIGIMNTWRFNKHENIKIIFNKNKDIEIKKLILYKRNIL